MLSTADSNIITVLSTADSNIAKFVHQIQCYFELGRYKPRQHILECSKNASDLKHSKNIIYKVRPVLTKWATSRQGTKGDMAHWTFQNSIENRGISQGKKMFFLDPK